MCPTEEAGPGCVECSGSRGRKGSSWVRRDQQDASKKEEPRLPASGAPSARLFPSKLHTKIPLADTENHILSPPHSTASADSGVRCPGLQVRTRNVHLHLQSRQVCHQPGQPTVSALPWARSCPSPPPPPPPCRVGALTTVLPASARPSQCSPNAPRAAETSGSGTASWCAMQATDSRTAPCGETQPT